MDLEKTDKSNVVDNTMFIILLLVVCGIGGCVIFKPSKVGANTVVAAPIKAPAPPLYPTEHGWQRANNTDDKTDPWLSIVKMPSGERVLITIQYHRDIVSVSTLLLPPLPVPARPEVESTGK